MSFWSSVGSNAQRLFDFGLKMGERNVPKVFDFTLAAGQKLLPGLGSLPERHSELALEGLYESYQILQRAEDALHAGKCSQMPLILSQLDRSIGRCEAHLEEARSTKDYARLYRDWEQFNEVRTELLMRMTRVCRGTSTNHANLADLAQLPCR